MVSASCPACQAAKLAQDPLGLEPRVGSLAGECGTWRERGLASLLRGPLVPLSVSHDHKTACAGVTLPGHPRIFPSKLVRRTTICEFMPRFAVLAKVEGLVSSEAVHRDARSIDDHEGVPVLARCLQRCAGGTRPSSGARVLRPRTAISTTDRTNTESGSICT
jgi:hypothetical protein